MKRILASLVLLWLAWTPVHAGQMTLLGAGVTSAGGGRTCTDDTASANFLSRTGGSAPNYGAGSTRYADAICTFIKALETAGLITGTLGGAQTCGTILDVVYLLKASNATNAGLNICGTAFTLVNHGATFTADVGYTGAAASYADTQFNPTTAAGNFADLNASFFAATSTNFVAATDYGSMGANGSLVSRLYPHFSDNNFYYSVNGSTNQSRATVGHVYGVTRIASTGETSYVDAVSATDLITSVALPNANFLLFADSTGGSAPFTGVETFYLIGASMTGTQITALQSAYTTYAASVP